MTGGDLAPRTDAESIAPGEANGGGIDAENAYEERRARHAARASVLARRDRRLGALRLATFAAGVAVAFLAFGTRSLSAGWLAPIAALFVALLVVHDRVIRGRTRAERAVAYYERGLSRIRDAWAGGGVVDGAERADGHPYARDLDLFGAGSLFELLCTARTPAGEDRLARWLLAPAAAAEIRARQAAVDELRARIDLREDLSLLGDDVRSQLDPAALVRWGAAAAAPRGHGARIAAAAASAGTAAAAAVLFATDAGAIPLVAALALQLAVAAALRPRVRAAAGSAGNAMRDLALLAGLLERIEREPVTCARLVELRRALDSEGEPPSARIAQLQRLVDFLDARLNQFFAPIGALLLWGTHFGLAIEHWRAHHGGVLARWIDAAAEIEALAALACYAWEHPADPFPEIVEDDAILEGRALGHPLLASAVCVRNDVSLGSARRAYMVSGSNMSGKSTLLRTVGTNTVLALAGAPVRAESMRVSPLAVGASIQVVDSLQSGTSHFYAEIVRLRQVMDLTAGELPVLFLLDEVLHGTNSHDRRIGAEAVLRGLLDRGAIGLITTHDLALAKIADDMAPKVENVHFQDTLVDGRMVFDYALQPGVVTRSNALELMRTIGLEV